MSWMAGRRRGVAAIACAAILVAALAAATRAQAGKYAVAQCGWHLDADVSWADTTGGAKFRPDAYCATPADADPFDGAHLKSFTRDGAQTVSGTRFARWRWSAPAGTGITQVRGTWWHTLHDGMEQRLGTDPGTGAFDLFDRAAATDVTPRDFVAGFSLPQTAFEDRLLCARAESKWCSLEPGSWSALRALTITVEDDGAPGGSIGGELTEGGWRRGDQTLGVSASDVGSGVRFSETLLDGARVALTEYPCSKALIGGEWRATAMQPCYSSVSAQQTVATTNFSDGNHVLDHCFTDFAGNVGCVTPRTIGIDNNAPAHPRSLALAGGDGWRRANDFDLTWSNPDQGRASPIWGAYWRITGPAGFDSGIQFVGGRDVAALADRTVPAAGVYSLHLWLRDEAGNDDPASALEVPLRFDDVPPGVAFAAAPDGGESFPSTVEAEIADAHSGAAEGAIACRRVGSDEWIDLPTSFERLPAGGGRLVASLPDSLEPGIYSFRAEATDAAGNRTVTTKRVDQTEMTLRKPAPAPMAPRQAVGGGRPAPRATVKTRIFATLRWRHRRGTSITVPYSRPALLRGRLLDSDGAGLAGRKLRVVSRPSRGALSSRRVETVVTGPHGVFRLALPPGPSRRISVSFHGDGELAAALRAPLTLRVPARVLFHAAPASLRTGEAVRLWGRVAARGAPLPRRGKLVAIQYLEAATGRWRPVLVLRTGHDGRFRTRYRFRYVHGRARIRLRAVALPEERWPYAPGASPAVEVIVSG